MFHYLASISLIFYASTYHAFCYFVSRLRIIAGTFRVTDHRHRHVLKPNWAAWASWNNRFQRLPESFVFLTATRRFERHLVSTWTESSPSRDNGRFPNIIPILRSTDRSYIVIQIDCCLGCHDANVIVQSNSIVLQKSKKVHEIEKQNESQFNCASCSNNINLRLRAYENSKFELFVLDLHLLFCRGHQALGRYLMVYCNHTEPFVTK